MPRMASLGWNMKSWRSSSFMRPCSVDRLTSLPDDLLTRILSMLPTKDAAATQVLSKRMRQPFCWITSVDLDDSPVSHCVENPHLLERFSLFESFIDNVLHKLSQSQQPLTRFRLRMGSDKTILIRLYYKGHRCRQTCFPNPEPARLYAWISYPLAHCGLRELDLTIYVRNPAECKLPPGIFSRQALEVLRLDSNLEIDTEIPLIHLPNLKILNLHSFVFNEDDFVTRLVSNCPVLEDLSITNCWWEKGDRLIISSHSLRRFAVIILRYNDEEKNSGLVLIDTPNLQYFKYSDNLAFSYVTHFNALVEASIEVVYLLQFVTFETSFRIQLSFARALSNVQHLTLLRSSVEGFYFAGKLKDQLPLFRNLKTLKLAALCRSYCSARWDIVLWLVLQRSPLLEELVFLEGFFLDGEEACDYHDLDNADDAAALQAAGCGITQIIPSCCVSYLKRIRIDRCWGLDKELNMIRFLLGNASVLKEFVIFKSKTPNGPNGVLFDAPSFDQFKNALEEIPRASNSCSIIYSDHEPTFI